MSDATQPSFGDLLCRVAPLMAKAGYSRQVDKLVGVNKEMSADPWLWEALGPRTRRLTGAVASGDEERALMMLKAGARVSDKALSEACNRGHLRVVKELIKRFAFVRLEHLIQAIEAGHQHLVPALAADICETMGAKKMRKKGKPLIGTEILLFRMTFDSIDRPCTKDKMNALMLAAHLGQMESVRALLDVGANIRLCWETNRLDPSRFPGDSAIMWTDLTPILEIAETSSSPHREEVVALLKQRGATYKGKRRQTREDPKGKKSKRS
jgi:ankyrin repeat protein